MSKIPKLKLPTYELKYMVKEKYKSYYFEKNPRLLLNS